MSLVINTNTQSLFAQRALNANTVGLKSNIEHLSTGYRINRAADDAAGLSISNKLTTTIRGLEKAKQNASDGISLIQTAEGGLQIIQENLQRIRELVVQGKNGTNGSNEADALQREINERVKTIQSISKSVKFNGLDLIYSNTASTADISLQTGAGDGETTALTFRSGITANAGIDIDTTYERTGTSSDYGTLVEGISTASFGLHRIHLGTSSMTVNSVDKINDTSSGVNAVVTLDEMDTMINNISRMRSYLGAAQNALESKVDYIDTAMENASASRSRIQDVDVARESSILVRNQILQQTSAAMLSQANTQPQIALQLISSR
jgi:flagellin